MLMDYERNQAVFWWKGGKNNPLSYWRVNGEVFVKLTTSHVQRPTKEILKSKAINSKIR